MSVTKCLEAAIGLSDEDTDNFIGLFYAYRRSLPESEAARAAVTDLGESIRSEKTETMDLILGQNPDLAHPEKKLFSAAKMTPAEFRQAENDFRQRQAGWTIDDHYAVAVQNQELFNRVAGLVAGIAGESFVTAPAKYSGHPSGIKGRKSAARKLKDKYRGDGSRMTDIVRGTFELGSPRNATRIIQMLGEVFNVLDEGWNITSSGYFDRKVLVQFDNGQIGEIQISAKSLLEAKHAGAHKIYAQWREKVDFNNGEFSVKEGENESIVSMMSRTMTAMYYQALVRDSNPEWKDLYNQLVDQMPSEASTSLREITEPLESIEKTTSSLSTGSSNEPDSLSNERTDLPPGFSKRTNTDESDLNASTGLPAAPGSLESFSDINAFTSSRIIPRVTVSVADNRWHISPVPGELNVSDGDFTTWSGSFDSSAVTQPVTLDELRHTIRQLVRNYQSLRGVNFVTMNSQDERFGPGSEKRHKKIKGGFDAGTDTIYLFAQNLDSTEDLHTVIRHELVGHYGFRKLLNRSGEFDRVLDRVYNSRTGELMDEYIWVENVYGAALFQTDIDGNLVRDARGRLIPRDARKVADEMIARATETQPESNIVTWVIDRINQLLRLVGLADIRNKMSRRELESLIRLSARRIKKSPPPSSSVGYDYDPDYGLGDFRTMLAVEELERIQAGAMPTTRKGIQMALKEIGLPATGKTADMEAMLLAARKNPSTWTRDEFDMLLPNIMIHQDLRGKHDANTIKSIMTDGLGRGMVDPLGGIAGRGYSHVGGLVGNDAYLFWPNLKYKGSSASLAPGNKPFFHFKPSKGQDVYEAITTPKQMEMDWSSPEKLPMDQESRLKRARDMGFDTSTVMYRGSVRGQKSFRPNPFTGMIHVTTDLRTANEFAIDGNSEIYEVYINPGKMWDFENKDDVEWLKSAINKDVVLDQLADPDISGLASFIEIVGRDEAYQHFFTGIDEGAFASLEIPHVYETIRAAGYNSIKMLEDLQTQGYNVALFEPSRIRSTNAAFDPSFADSADLLMRLAPAGQPQSNGFQNWFGDSKVVNEDGSPMRLYHGTPRDFESFDMAHNGFTTKGWFSDSPDVANEYASRNGGNVVPVYIRMENPVHPRDAVEAAAKAKIPASKREAWIKERWDGLVFEERGATTYIPFDSGQVKSAVGNSGDFNTDTDSLIFRLAGNSPVGNTLGMPDETWREKFVRLAQNGFNRVKKLQETIEARGGPVPPEADVYRTEELSSGKIAYRLDQLKKNRMDALMKIMSEADISLDELDRFLIARHAQERNAHIATINDDMPDGGSGLSNQEAMALLNDFAQDADKLQALDRAAAIVYAVNDQHLQDLVAGGHLDQQTADDWRGRYRYYVPLKGKEGEETRSPLGFGYSVLGAGIKRAMGRGVGNIAESPTAHSFAQAETTIVRTEKSAVGQALLNLIRLNPDSGFWTVGQRTYRRMEDQFGQAFEGYDDPPDGLIENIDYHRVINSEGKVVFRLDPGYRHRDDVFAVMADGQEYLVNIKDPVLMEQLKKMNTTQLNALTAGIGAVNRYLAMINTALNPEFVITNFERDFQTAMVNLGGEHSADIAARVMLDIPRAIRGIWQATFDTAGQSEYRQVFEEMQQEGGAIGFFGLEDIETRVKNIQSKLDQPTGLVGRSRKLLAGLRDVVLDANLSVENAARAAAYKVIRDEAIARGISKKEARKQAASVAKNLTVNFNRKGELAPVMNSLYLFYNASIQGTARMLTALENTRVRKIVTGIALTSFALAMYNRGAGGDDDDGIPFWDKIPDYEKQTNLIVMHPDGSGNYSKVRLPYGYNVFSYTGTTVHDMMFSDDVSVIKAATNMAAAAMNAFNPISGADLLDTVTPTFLKPYEQDVRNMNFASQPIKPEYPFDRYERPESQKSWNSTNPYIKELAEALNDSTGGDLTHSGLIDLSPETMKHYIGWLTGGAGMTAFRSIDTAINAVTGNEIEQRNIPFVRTLGSSPSDRYDKDRFYSAIEEIEAVKAHLDLLKGKDDWAEYLAENEPVYKLSLKARAVKRRVSDLNEQADKAKQDGDNLKAADIKEQIRQRMMEFSLEFDNAVAERDEL